MASLIDSFREIISEKWFFAKFIVLAIPVYFSYQTYLNAGQDFAGFAFLAIITFFLLFGFLIRVSNNVLNERVNILPSLDPIMMIFSSFKGVIAILPMALVSCLLANYISSLVNLGSWVDIVVKVVIWSIAASLIIFSFLMFVSHEKVSEAFKIKFVFEKLGDLIALIYSFIIQGIMLNMFTTVFVGYAIFLLFGYGPVLDFVLSIALIFNIAILGHYLGQSHYTLIGYQDNY